MKQAGFFILLLVLSGFSGCDLISVQQEMLNGPTLAVEGPDGAIYVGDGYGNSRIVVFNRAGEVVRQFGTRGYADGQLQNPHSLAFGPDACLYVADRDNGRIQKFDKNGQWVESWSSKELGRPWGVAVAGDGTVYAVDGGDQNDEKPRSGIVKLSPSGVLLVRFSRFGSSAGELDWGHSICVSPGGDSVYVADYHNDRIQLFVSGSQGTSFTVAAGWSSTTTGERYQPLGVALQGTTLYVTQDGAGKPVLKFNAATGQKTGELGAGLFQRAHGVSVTRSRTLLITDVDANKVFEISLNGTILKVYGGGA